MTFALQTSFSAQVNSMTSGDKKVRYLDERRFKHVAFQTDGTNRVRCLMILLNWLD
jgi:hypothetical protein